MGLNLRTPNGYNQRATNNKMGYMRFATAAEAAAGDLDSVAIPASLATASIPDASTTVKGKVELATDAETVTGTDAVRAVTPAGLTARLAAPGAIGGTTPAAGTFTALTATTGAVTATLGNLATSAAGAGLLLNPTTATGAAASPVVLNTRVGQIVFSSVSIAAAQELTLTNTNSAITGSSTQVQWCMSGATTGSALSVKSFTTGSGTQAWVITNGTGATTTTADIKIMFMVMN